MLNQERKAESTPQGTSSSAADPATSGKGSWTPGPWRVNRHRIEYGPIIAGDGFCVAMVLRDPPEHGANARLIAAAPELLAALEAAAICLADHTPLHEPTRNQIRAALAAVKEG